MENRSSNASRAAMGPKAHLAPEAEPSAAHAPDCPVTKARTGAVGIECEHGYDYCPICDRCTCGSFQPRVEPWMRECFGDVIPFDKIERADRFTEEALELVQTTPGFTRDRAHALVDYVFSRPVGEPAQEVGGVMVTLAAYCLANDLDMHEAGETELARIWTKVPQIRAKPTGSALPEPQLQAPRQSEWRPIEGKRQLDPAGFVELVQASPGFWVKDFSLKYLTLTIDTREPTAFWLADRDGKPIEPQRVLDAIRPAHMGATDNQSQSGEE